MHEDDTLQLHRVFNPSPTVTAFVALCRNGFVACACSAVTRRVQRIFKGIAVPVHSQRRSAEYSQQPTRSGYSRWYPMRQDTAVSIHLYSPPLKDQDYQSADGHRKTLP